MKDGLSSRNAVIVTCEYPPFPGGIGSYAGQIAVQLQELGVSVTVVAPDYPSLGPVDDEGDVVRLFGHHKIRPAAALAAFRLLSRQPSATPVLAADIRSIMLVAAWSRITRRPFRAMVHGSEATKFRGRSIKGAIVSGAYCQAETILANSQATLGIFEQSFGKTRDGRVTHLGIDPIWLAEPKSESFANPKLQQLPEALRLLVTVGRIEDRKGQLEAIRMVAQAKHRGAGNLGYVAVGRVEDEGYARQLRAEAETLGVPLIQPGQLSVDDIKLLYKRSVAHLLLAQPLPTKVEGFGLVLLEAAAQHCPSVTTRVGGIPEVVGDGCGLLFEADDSEGLVAAIIRLCNDNEFRRSEASRAYVRTQLFDWRRCTELTFPEFA
jgi:phosphatidylinositol alpha-1,6-mannosyltransferase